MAKRTASCPKRTVNCLVSSIYNNIVGHTEGDLTSVEVMDIHRRNRANGFFYNSVTKRYEPIHGIKLSYNDIRSYSNNKGNNLNIVSENVKEYPIPKKRLKLKSNKKMYAIKRTDK